jgi:prepilin-type N-terminal cleavage/methylation domain-containing protein
MTQSRRHPAGGFTLVEVLLVLALLALVVAILLPAAGSILRNSRAGSPEDALATVFQQVRREAVLSGRELTLRFETDQQRFAWETSTAPIGPEGERIRIEFLRPGPGSAVLIGGRLVETSVVPALHFFPDGTCDPVRVQIRAGDRAARVLAIDPWTCAPGLEVKS